MRAPTSPHIAGLASLMASVAFRLPRYEALIYLRDVDVAAEPHSDAMSVKAATAIVRRDILAASTA